MTRHCGSCTLCCRLLPTEEVNSAANTKCVHQCSKGCRIYAQRPLSCQLWSCRWLLGEDTADQPRPDRSHIVLDLMPDVIRASDDKTGEQHAMPCLVAWIDPAHRDAWKAPAFQHYVERQTMPVLIRYSSADSGGVLFPPAVTGEPGVLWHDSQLGADMPQTLREKAAALGAVLSETPSAGEYQPVTMTMPDGTQHTIAATTVVEVKRV